MDTFPIEIWENVLAHLLDPSDIANVADASTIFQEILDKSKSSWLLARVLPCLSEYLPKSDIFRCRKVCRHWRHAVDHYLENHAYQRPAWREPWPVWNERTDFPLGVMMMPFLDKRLAFHSGSDNVRKRSEMLRNASNHPRCPIVGRSVRITESLGIGAVHIWKLHDNFFRTFGDHIWFLRIEMRFFTAAQTLQRILHLLDFLPSLKKLDVYAEIDDIPVAVQALTIGLTSGDASTAQGHTLDFVESSIEPERKDRLPKLETITTTIKGELSAILTEYLFRILPTEKIMTSWLGDMPANISQLKLGSLVDLDVPVNSDAALQQLTTLNCPIKRLNLTLTDRALASTLFSVLKHFGPTIRNFNLTLKSDFSAVFGSEPSELEHFTNCDILREIPTMKRVGLDEFSPKSLNFLCGLGHSLEYLDIVTWHEELTHELVQKMQNEENLTEKLDVLRLLQVLPYNESKLMYESNVWKVFPKLKEVRVGVKIRRLGMTFPYKFRREVYDKLSTKLVSKVDNDSCFELD